MCSQLNIKTCLPFYEDKHSFYTFHQLPHAIKLWADASAGSIEKHKHEDFHISCKHLHMLSAFLWVETGCRSCITPLSRSVEAVARTTFHKLRSPMTGASHSKAISMVRRSVLFCLDSCTHIATFVREGGRKWQLNEQTGCRERGSSAEANRKLIRH